MHSDYTAYRSHLLREAELVRRLEERRQALERIPAPPRRRWALRLFRRAQVIRTS
jgi:hypothetical protein